MKRISLKKDEHIVYIKVVRYEPVAGVKITIIELVLVAALRLKSRPGRSTQIYPEVESKKFFFH